MEWFLRRCGDLPLNQMSTEDCYLVDDILGCLDARYRLLLRPGASSLVEDERIFSFHSVTAFLALALLCGLSVDLRPTATAAVTSPIVIPDSDEEESPL